MTSGLVTNTYGWSSATVSRCGRYRYALARTWAEDLQRICWVMLNPSTADELIDDPTVRRCISFSKTWGFGGLMVVNLFALRSTDPRILREVEDPVGPENDAAIIGAAKSCSQVITAWGEHGKYRDRGVEVLGLLRIALPDFPVWHLGKNASGQPKHPLYLAKSSERIAW